MKIVVLTASQHSKFNKYTAQRSHLSKSWASLIIFVTRHSKLFCSSKIPRAKFNKIYGNTKEDTKIPIHIQNWSIIKTIEVYLLVTFEIWNEFKFSTKWKNVIFVVLAWFLLYSSMDISNSCAFCIPIPQNVKYRWKTSTSCCVNSWGSSVLLIIWATPITSPS